MAYLTTQEYLDRYGEAETIRLTDEDRTGTVDTAKLTSALNDATEEAEAYIGKRYAIPLAAPNSLVKSIVGALARDLLHKTRPSPAVKEDAERARTQLRDLARGLIALPTVDGPAVEDGRAPADSASSGDGVSPIFTEQNLAGFGVPSGGSVSRWRQ